MSDQDKLAAIMNVAHRVSRGGPDPGIFTEDDSVQLVELEDNEISGTHHMTSLESQEMRDMLEVMDAVTETVRK